VCILSAEPRWQRLPEDYMCEGVGVCGCVYTVSRTTLAAFARGTEECVCVGVGGWVCAGVCILSAEPRWQRLPED
jgi:hypothetical protein